MPRWPAVDDRLTARLAADPSGCLLWTGLLDKDGYGRTWLDGRKQLVHRVVWELLNGPIAEGMQLDHLCRVRRCASIDHLEVVTNRVNALRGESFSAVNARKQHCPAGHEYNLLTITSRGFRERRCSICRRRENREAGRRWRAKSITS